MFSEMGTRCFTLFREQAASSSDYCSVKSTYTLRYISISRGTINLSFYICVQPIMKSACASALSEQSVFAGRSIDRISFNAFRARTGQTARVYMWKE